MYCDMFGIQTNDSHRSNSFNLEENNIKSIAHEIAMIIRDTNAIFFNIQIPNEGSQFDIFMSVNYYNQGIHQRGIHGRDLIIGIIGGGCFGFDCDKIVFTSVGYYNEKLKVCSDMLMLLFNNIRMELGEMEI